MKTTYPILNWTAKERFKIFFQDLKDLPNDISEDGLVGAILDTFTQRYLK